MEGAADVVDSLFIYDSGQIFISSVACCCVILSTLQQHPILPGR